MKLHILQHVHFEGPSYIMEWAKDRGAIITYTKLYEESYNFPPLETIDFLVILGGPMSVNEIEFFPWLREEVRFIQKCITTAVPILGICLGAQLIATALGAKIGVATNKEIGWYPVLNCNATNEWPWHLFDSAPKVFHWHSEQFEIPEKAEGMLKSEANNNQGFAYGKKIIALQFHLEATQESILKMLQNAGNDLTKDQFVQPEEEILAGVISYVSQSNHILRQILDGMIEE